MPSLSTISFAETLALFFALFSFTYAWDGLIRRHIVMNNLTIGRIDLHGWKAIAVGGLALLILIGSLSEIVAVWRQIATACHGALSCGANAAALALASNWGMTIPLFISVSWVLIWSTRGPEGYIRQWIGPGTYMDEGELVKRVQQALAKAGEPPVEAALILKIADALKLRMAPIAFQRNSPFVEDGNLVIHRFVGSIVSSAFGNQFHLPKAQLKIILTAITEYYAYVGSRAKARPRSQINVDA